MCLGFSSHVPWRLTGSPAGRCRVRHWAPCALRPGCLAARPWSNHQRCQLMSSRKHQTFSQQHNIWLVLTLFHIVIYYHILCVNILSYIAIYYQYVPPCWWENTLKDVCIFAGSAGSATKTAFQCLEGSCDKKDPLDPIKKRWVVHPKMLIIS